MKNDRYRNKSNINTFEGRIYQLEQKIKHMPEVGDKIELQSHVYGDIDHYNEFEINHILKRGEQNEYVLNDDVNEYILNDVDETFNFVRTHVNCPQLKKDVRKNEN